MAKQVSFEWIRSNLPEKVAEEIERTAKEKKLSEKEKQTLYERAAQNYMAVQVDPGEAVGIISAQSIGEPGTQMSVKYDEKVIIKQDSEIKAVKIGEFIDAKMQEYGHVTEDGHDILDLKEEIYVPSFTADEQTEWKRISAISRHKSPEKLVKIKTRSGREITATPFHSFVIRQNNKIVPIAGSKLKQGDRIPAIKMLTLTAQEAAGVVNVQPLLEEVPFLTAADGQLYAYPRASSRPLPQNIELNEEFGWLVGIYLSEGNATRSYISISNTDSVIQEKIRVFARKYNLTFNEYDNYRGFAKGHDIRINSTLLSQLLKATCKSGAALKHIPEFAYSASDAFVANLLRGYFDGDGNVNLQRKVIRVCSKSKDLIDGAALLLNRLGIFSTKNYDGKSHWLSISHRYAKTYLEVIGSDVDYKKKELENLSEIQSETTDYNLVDVIPGIGTVLFDCAKKLGVPTRLVNNFTKRQKIGRSTIRKYTKLFESLAAKQDANIEQELSTMRRAAESDVVWDEIASVEYVEPEHRNVYDFTVPDSETFATFDGLITHNTMRTHHFVGVAELNVTLGLPRIIEIFDARKDPKTPSMTIYLKAPHNKSRQAAEKVAARIKQVTLKELAKEVVLNLAELSITVNLEREELTRHDTTPELVAMAIERQLKVKVDRSGGTLTIKSKDQDLKKLYRFKEKVKDVTVAGIKDVTDVLPVYKKEADEFAIQTFGTNIKEVMQIEEVDEHRIMTNNFIEIAKVLGIEAARTAIVNEVMSVLAEQGIDVDIRHVMIVADLMTSTGEVKGITRHGITSQKTSVLARASFEIPLKHLIDASIVGEADKLTSVVENVMINQPVPIGTGLPDLIVKMDKKKESKE